MCFQYLPTFSIDFGGNLTFSDSNGTYLPFNNQLLDPNNLFDGETYQVPFTGLYNVFGEIVVSRLLFGVQTCQNRNRLI